MASNAKTAKKGRTTKTQKSDITFPVARFQSKLRKGNYAKRIGTGAAVYCAAAIEYLVAELMELSAAAAHDNKRKRINPRHITLAVQNDDELKALLDNVTIASGGVLPFIHPVLLSKKKRTAKMTAD